MKRLTQPKRSTMNRLLKWAKDPKRPTRKNSWRRTKENFKPQLMSSIEIRMIWILKFVTSTMKLTGRCHLTVQHSTFARHQNAGD